LRVIVLINLLTSTFDILSQNNRNLGTVEDSTEFEGRTDSRFAGGSMLMGRRYKDTGATLGWPEACCLEKLFQK